MLSTYRRAREGIDEALIPSAMHSGLGAADIHGAMSVSDAMAAAGAVGSLMGAIPGLNGDSPSVSAAAVLGAKCVPLVCSWVNKVAGLKHD